MRQVMGPGSGSVEMSTSPTEAFKFAKLNGENYALWFQHMQSSLQARYLWLIVTGDEPCPEKHSDTQPTEPTALTTWKATKKEWLDWSLRDQAAQGLMKGAAEPSQWPHIAQTKTAKEMWDAWKKMYVTNQQHINVHYYFEDLYTRKYDESTSMADHIAAMLDLGLKIKAAGEEIPDIHIARALVLSLPRTQTWELVKVQLFSKEKLTSDIVSTELQATANRTAHEKKSETAFLAGKKQASGKGDSKKKGGRGPKPDDECRYCHSKGHWISKCPKREEDEKKNNRGSANLAVSNLRDLGAREIGRVFMAGEVSAKGSGINAELILDCGATSHMFCDRHFFTSYTPTSTPESISVGDRRDIPVAGRGTIRFQARLLDGYRSITLHSALHVPKLAANLISLGTLQQQGVGFSSYQNGIVIKLGEEELFRASFVDKSDTLYHVEVAQMQTESAYVATSGSLRLWHRRLGHISLDTIRRMHRKNMVEGLSINSLHQYDHLCEGCALGKSHRLQFPKISTTKYELMDLIVLDLTGPMSVPTWGGASYALVIVEVSCRKPVGRLLNSKKEAYAAIREVVVMLERQSGKKLKRMRADSGTEFVNELVNTFCQKNGIVLETMVPYTPEQNGIAERAIAVFFEMVRCMLHASKMDLRYWGEAFLYAVHIRSLTHTSALDNIVPAHAWSGTKPDVSHLRIFGSVAYANIPKKVRGGKLEVTSIKCRLLGWWADETKGYRLEDVETGKIITARDVRFAEDDSPGDLAVIETRGVAPTEAEIDRLVPDDVFGKTAGSVSPISQSKSSPQPAAAVEPPIPSVDDASPTLEADVSVPRKTSKWDNLPPRDHPRHERKPAIPPGDEATEEEFLLASNRTLDNRAFITYPNEPQTYKQAMRSSYSKQWEKAIATEYDTLRNTGTFEWVPSLPHRRKAVGSRFVFREKHDGNGNLVKHKARIVAKGFSQVPGEDFSETFSSVAKFTTLRTLLALIAHSDLELHQVDVVGAYLRGSLDEEIYMEVPEGVREEGKEGWYWKLKKPLYGLKQAGRQWKVKLNEVMRNLRFEKGQADDCLYILREKGEIVMLVLVYVDDMAVAGRSLARITQFKNDLTKVFDITDLGELKYILGIQVKRDRKACTISLNQTAYIHHVLARFGMKDCTPVSTPLAVKHDLSVSQSPKTEKERTEYTKYANGIHYLEIVGSLLYATQTRPDIQFPVGLISQFGGNPGKPHLEAAKRIMRYLKGTAHFGLVLGRRGEGSFDVVGWTDSSWAQDPDSRRSVGGFVFDVAGSSVSWSSKRQPTVALSTVEAEYMASLNATKEAIWLRVLLEDMGFPQTMATLIHADNQGCIALARNPVAHSRAKHIDIRHHFIREWFQNSEIRLEYCSTKDMFADIFTKQLPCEAFETFRSVLGVVAV